MDKLKKEVNEYLNSQTLPRMNSLVYSVIKNLLFGFAEPRERHISELEKENKQLKEDYECLEGAHTVLNELYEKLEKENAGLKENSTFLNNLVKEKEQRGLEIQEDLLKEKENLEAQIEKMRKYGKLLQDICVVMGNDPYMVSAGLENRVKVLWDDSEEKEGLKMVEDIESRLLEIKPQDWAEIGK